MRKISKTNKLYAQEAVSDKSLWRKEGLKNRRSLSSEIRAEKSKMIFDCLTNTSFFAEAENIFCYVNMADEVQTLNFIKKSLNLGKIVSVPKIIGKGLMEAVRVTSPADFVRGEYGICTVREGVCEKLSPDYIDLIIVPGTAFDIAGSRIGMGGGFYDRFFPFAACAEKVGVCYSCQLFDKIPTEAHDVVMDIIITETEIIKIKGDTER